MSHISSIPNQVESVGKYSTCSQCICCLDEDAAVEFGTVHAGSQPGRLSMSQERTKKFRKALAKSNFPAWKERDSGDRWPGPASDVSGDTLAEARLLSRIYPQLDSERADLNQSSSDFYGNAQEFLLTLLRLPAADSIVALLHA